MTKFGHSPKPRKHNYLHITINQFHITSPKELQMQDYVAGVTIIEGMCVCASSLLSFKKQCRNLNFH